MAVTTCCWLRKIEIGFSTMANVSQASPSSLKIFILLIKVLSSGLGFILISNPHDTILLFQDEYSERDV
tara:strand:- start:865 stop:1071 length:207 start_codon:yes stop_codon:yes gene_type:complete